MGLKVRQFLGVEGRQRGLVVLAAIIPGLLFCTYLLEGAEADQLGVSFSAAWIGLGLTAVALTQGRYITNGMLIALAAGAAWAVFGGFGNWHLARIEVITLCGAGGLFLAGHTLARSGGLLSLAWRFTIWVILAFAAIAIAMQLVRYTADPLSVLPVDKHRLRGTLDHANTAATLFAIGAVLAVGQMLYTADHPDRSEITRGQVIDGLFKRSLSSVLLVVLALACLVLTASRAGLAFGVAMVAVLAAMEYSVYRRRGARRPSKTTKRLKWVLGIGVPLIALIAFSSEMLLAQRAANLGSDAMSRFELYGVYWAAWQDAPLFGHGLGSFNRVNDSIATLETAHMVTLLNEAHNVALQWLIQQGVVGLALITAFIIAIHVPIVRFAFSSGARSRTFLRSAVCISGVVFLHGMVDYALEIPGVMWTFTWVLGLAHGRAAALGAPVVASDGTDIATEDETVTVGVDGAAPAV